MIRILLLRPYYGINVHGDMHGGLGMAEYLPHIFPDVSLILAATLVNNNSNYNAHIIDANAEKLFPKAVIKKLNSHYDKIIIKTSAPTVQFDIKFAVKLKKIFPKSYMIVTGHAVKILKKWINENIKEIDDISLVSIEDYVNNMINGAECNTTLDNFPIPDYTLFPINKYKDSDGILRASIYTSRGCVMGCSYCPYTAFYGKKIQIRSLHKVIDDMKTLINLGFKKILFRDQFFSFNKTRILKFCKLIKEHNINIKWSCETRIDSLDYNIIDNMIEAGMDMICFGIESASKKILSDYKREPFKLTEISNLIKYLNKRKVITLGFYIIGFPDDTWESLMNTYKLALKLRTSHVKFSIYAQYPFHDTWDNKNYNITPEIFLQFKNKLRCNSSKNFTNKQLDEILHHITFMYNANVNGLKFAYDTYKYKNQSERDIKKIEKEILNDKLFKIDEIKTEKIINSGCPIT